MVTATLVIERGVPGALVASGSVSAAALPPSNQPTVQVRIVDPAGKPVEEAVILPSTLQTVE